MGRGAVGSVATSQCWGLRFDPDLGYCLCAFFSMLSTHACLGFVWVPWFSFHLPKRSEV